MDKEAKGVPNTLRVKCVVLGDPQVGKSSLLAQLVSEGKNFPKNYLPTLGADLVHKAINIPDTSDAVELYLCDSSGREDLYGSFFQELWSSQEIGLVALVYDVSKEESFKSLGNWMNLLKESIQGEKEDEDPMEEDENSPNPSSPSILPGVLIANKSDLKARRTVSPKQGTDLASQLSLVYFETSAKEPSGAAEEPFYYLANEWYKFYNEKVGRILSNGV